MGHPDTKAGLKRWAAAFAAILVFAVALMAALGPGAVERSATTALMVPAADTSVIAPASTRDSSVIDTVEAAEADEDAARFLATGQASYYGEGFAGRPTANGETFDPSEMTAAHKTLPFGTRLRVTNRATGRSVVVRVNDRGPYAHGRILDLSEGAARKIGMIASGTARVDVEVLS